MPNGAASGPDGISVEILKAGGVSTDQQLPSLYNKCFKENKIPKSWKSSKLVFIHKKGDNKDLKNYRPISLPSIVYKVLTKIQTLRLTRNLRLRRVLYENQPIEGRFPVRIFYNWSHAYGESVERKMCRIPRHFVLHFLTMRKHLRV